MELNFLFLYLEICVESGGEVFVHLLSGSGLQADHNHLLAQHLSGVSAAVFSR